MNNPVNDIEAKKRRKKNYLLSIRNLPAIPIVTQQVLQLLDNQMSSTADIANLISKDQGLTAKILTVANSPLYGLPRKVPSIDFAILILGFNQIKQIVIALSMMDTFKNEDDKYWNKKAFWTHSFMTAMTAKGIANDLGYHKTGEAFTAGLLHDLGVTVIQKYFNKEFQMINEMVYEQGIPFEVAEVSTMGMSHQEVAKVLSDRWHLPKNLGDAIYYHHNPSESEDNAKLSSIVHLADYMVNVLECGSFNWDEGKEFDPEAIEILKLGNMEYVEKFIESYKDQLSDQMKQLIF